MDEDSHFSCSITDDRRFGPAVECQQFDFTLLFEQSILGIGISAAFLLLFVFRIVGLYGASVKTLPNSIYGFKLATSCISLAIQIACLPLWTQQRITQVTLAAATLGFMSSLAVTALVAREHNRTIRPSTLTSVYLLIAIAADATQLRTLLLRNYVPTIAKLLPFSLFGKVVLLVLESLSKRSYLRDREQYGPEELTGIYGRSVFWWLNALFLRGNRQVLSLDDLYPLDRDLHSDKLQTGMQHVWQKNKTQAHGFLFTSVNFLKWHLLQTVPFRAAMIAFSYSQTFLITATIHYLETPASERDVRRAYGLVGAAVLIYVGLAISTARYNHKVYRMATLFRGAATGLVYSKSLSAIEKQNHSAAITLMSTDVDRIVSSLTMGTDMWANVVAIAIGIWLLWRQLGGIAVVPILMVIICFVAQTWISPRMGREQGVWVQAVQRRVGTASTVLRSLKSIKLSGRVESMIKLLQAERRREMQKAKAFRWLTAVVNVVANMPSQLSTLIAFAAYAIQAKIRHTAPLSTSQAFTSFALLTLVTGPAAILLHSIPMVLAASGCINRIQEYLLSDDFDDRRSISHQGSRGMEEKAEIFLKEHKSSINIVEQTALSLNGVVLDLGSDESKEPGSPIQLEVNPGTVTMITGVVGSGKSTLLKVILGESKPRSGSVFVQTPVMGYCPQTPWLQNSTIRANIIGPSGLDESWYRKVLHLSALEPDLDQMPLSDLTGVGSKGLALSGGQKHRIALARALYSRCQILLLDDFTSSLDRESQEVICTRLFSKEGHVRTFRCTVVLATHSLHLARFADTIVELNKGGSMKYCGPPKDLESGGTENKSNSLISDSPTWDRVLQPDSNVSVETKKENSDASKRQTGDLSTWLYYAKMIGMVPIFVALFLIFTAAFLFHFQKLWLKWNTGNTAPALGKFIGVYATTTTITLILLGAMTLQLLLVVVPVSAINLHNVIVNAALKAPMSFLERTDSSVILNRFSQDMTLVDMALPLSSFSFFLALAMTLMNLALICVGSTYIVATIPFTLFALYLIQKFYLRTSRQIRLLDLEAKSPLYQQFTETLEGIISIRAFHWQQQLNRAALDRLDYSQKPYYLLFCIQRWLNLVLDLTVAAMGILVVALALCVSTSPAAAANLGVALVSILDVNSNLRSLITSWTEAEMSLGSVARTKSFGEDTPNEDSTDEALDFNSEANWPVGAVQVSNITVVYGDDTTSLRGVSFNVSPGQKVGIIGRTGSGKSTLVSALLRLVDLNKGSIIIDGRDITTIPRHIVLKRLICIPQDAAFAGTFRLNLDPDGETEDDVIRDVLKTVGVWDIVENRGDLTSEMQAETLSHGEQQLFAVARAILRRRAANGRCILVLDEATSNVDSATEALVQGLLWKEFKTNTIIVVAHRPEAIDQVDFVVRLEEGQVQEREKTSEV